MSRHRATRRHAGPRRWIGARHTPRHAAECPLPAPAAEPYGPRLVPAAGHEPAPPLADRPVGARPRGPMPYDADPPTAPFDAIGAAA